MWRSLWVTAEPSSGPNGSLDHRHGPDRPGATRSRGAAPGDNRCSPEVSDTLGRADRGHRAVPTPLRRTRDRSTVLFDVQHFERQGWQVIAVVGELDLAAAPRVRQAVVRALGSPALAATSHVVLDLGAVDFIDSSGLGVVIGAKRRVRSAGGELRVVVAEPQVRRVFALTDLDRILPLFDTIDAALAPAARPVTGRTPSGAGGHDG